MRTWHVRALVTLAPPSPRHCSRIRGVKTNIPFILNVLKHPDFLSGEATPSFIADRWA